MADERGVYWLQNTLLQTLTEEQMLAIAKSTRTLWLGLHRR